MADGIDRLRSLLGEGEWALPIHPKTPVSEKGQDVEQGPERRESWYNNAEDDGDEDADGEEIVGLNKSEFSSLRLFHSGFVLPEFNLETGELAPLGEKFSPLSALLNYPNHYLTGNRRQKVLQLFEKGKIYDRTWDFFYIYPPRDLGLRPILLLPSLQVEHFLATLNLKTRLELGIPADAIETCFIVDFPDDGTPRPRYIGRSTSRSMAESLKQAAPSYTWRLDNEAPPREPMDMSLEAFRRKIELMAEVDTRKKLAAKEKKKADQFSKRKAWGQAVKKVQQQLGLRDLPNGHQNAMNKIRAALASEYASKSADQYENAIKRAEAELFEQHKLACHKPAAYPFLNSVVFVCVDVEAYERNQKIITEVGIATLDTADLIGIAPGDEGAGWMSKIRARHFRIQENRRYFNSEFIQGCADKFRFGESEWIKRADAPRIIAECFREPFSRPGPIDMTSNALEDNGWDEPTSWPKRNIILVGHDLSADINYLENLGYSVYNLSNLRGKTDTSDMYRAFRRETNPRNLGSILADLGIAGWYLHNAGNDAVYTLQAMLGIAVKDIMNKQEKLIKETHDLKAKISEGIIKVIDDALDQAKGWDTDEDENHVRAEIKQTIDIAHARANLWDVGGSAGNSDSFDLALNVKKKESSSGVNYGRGHGPGRGRGQNNICSTPSVSPANVQKSGPKQQLPKTAAKGTDVEANKSWGNHW